MRNHQRSMRNDRPSHAEPERRTDIGAAFGDHRAGAPPRPADAEGLRAPRPPRARHAARLLGPVEWTLLAVILLAVGVTVAMAIFNPG